MYPIQVIAEDPERTAQAAELATRLQQQMAESPFALVWGEQHLELRKLDEPKLGPVFVDFVEGAVAHRRKFGGGRGQSIAKAVGLKAGANPTVVDATAGLGRDAFVLASLGCQVTMLERHPVVAALLADGLQRAQQDSEIGGWMRERMSLRSGPALENLQQLGFTPDVVYLDPMFPHRQKSALVKKRDAGVSVAGGGRSGCRCTVTGGVSGGGETGGGQASGLCRLSQRDEARHEY